MPDRKKQVFDLIERDFRANFKKRVQGRMQRNLSYHNAEDAVQEAYARACQYWDTYNPNQSFENWFSAVVDKAAIDQHRAEQRHGAVLSMDDVDLPVPDGLDTALMRKEILKRIQTKKGVVQTILRHWFVKGYSPKEIDQVVELSYGRIRNIITDFRNELKLEYS